MDNTKTISDFTSACNALAEAADQMLIILREKVTFEEYHEWAEFNLSHCEQEPIPLSAWLKKHRGVEKKE